MADALADAVEGRLGATWTSVDSTALPVVALNGQGETPLDGSPFIEIEYPVRNESQRTLGAPGANHFKEEGVFRIIVNERRTIGTQRVRAWITELRALFRGQFIDPVQCFEASGAVINNGNDLGNYWQMSFTVRYSTWNFG